MTASTALPASASGRRSRSGAAPVVGDQASVRGRRSWASAPLGSSPWTAGSAAVLTACVIIGAVGLLIAWFGASGSAKFRTELIWIAVGVGVCGLAALGEAIWLMAGWRRLGLERRAVAGLLQQRRALRAPEVPIADFSAESVPAYVAGAGMRKRHRPGCDVVRNKPVEALSVAECDARGLLSCGMCDS